MLTPTSPKPLPSTSSCDAGRLVAGATVAQIAIGALQVASVKLLGEAHYHIQQQGYTAAVPYQIPAPMDKGYEEAHQLLYATTPLTEWISFEVLYSATTFYDDLPTMQVSLKSVVGGAIDGTIDAGSVLDDFLETHDSAAVPPNTIASGWLIDGPPAGSASTVPRPLYVPEAYRGQVVCVRIVTSSASVLAVHLLDVYQEA
jgi:hypothetical protein